MRKYSPHIRRHLEKMGLAEPKEEKAVFSVVEDSCDDEQFHIEIENTALVIIDNKNECVSVEIHPWEEDGSRPVASTYATHEELKDEMVWPRIRKKENFVEKAIIIIGAPFDKQVVVGPFNSFEEAADYLEDNQEINIDFTWIITLNDPKEYRK